MAYFIGAITDTDNYYQHPANLGRFVANGTNVDINADAFKAFFNQFEHKYGPKELHKFHEISDRLVEDTKRRRSGEFYTPTPFVDYAHSMISEHLGDNWREEYVVWDCCCGTGNLTRDYHFKELYASTLEQAEIDQSRRYNQNATKFVFDFLNDPIEKNIVHPGVPLGLLDAFVNKKPIVFFINPPYATAGGGGANTENKENIAETKINKKMRSDDIGACRQNLYAQFLYRILLLKSAFHLSNINICLFSPTLYLSGPSWKKFRSHFFESFKFADACTFQASNFADVEGCWGISFSVWKGGANIERSTFKHRVIDFDEKIIELGHKYIYNLDNDISSSTWVQGTAPDTTKKEIITAKSSLKISDKVKNVSIHSKGFFINDANNVDATIKGVYLMTMPVSRHIGMVEMFADNFPRCTSLFAARKLIEKNWINSKDEYMAPNELHPMWGEFVNDSLIFSLFHTSSNQSSLRKVEYKGKLWDIKNDFFYISKNDIADLADICNLTDTYEEARTDTERYVYTLLKATTLSLEAQAVLDKAMSITRDTFRYREIFDQEHPEYQIKNWDCGWYQIKAVAKQYAPKQLEEFQLLFRALADKMRPLVYELGFLKK